MDRKTDNSAQDVRTKEAPTKPSKKVHNHAPAHRAQKHLIHTKAKRRA